MEMFLLVIVVVLYAVIAIRQHLEVREQERLDALRADRRYETKMRFKSEWRERQGAEAIYRESGAGLYALVRIRSIDADGHSVDISLDKIPSPGLPVSTGWPVRNSSDIGASWDYFSVTHNQWSSSPYCCWMLIFDPETIRAFKATAQKFQDETEAQRWKRLRECLREWDTKRLREL
jgi:hypothetical protein